MCKQIRNEAAAYLPEEFIRLADVFHEECWKRAGTYYRVGRCAPICAAAIRSFSAGENKAADFNDDYERTVCFGTQLVSYEPDCADTEIDLKKIYGYLQKKNITLIRKIDRRGMADVYLGQDDFESKELIIKIIGKDQHRKSHRNP